MDFGQIIDLTSDSEDDEIDVPNPNDLLRKDDLKRYTRQCLVILNATEVEDVHEHEQGESVHKHNCHMMEITMRRRSSLEICKIRLPPNTTEAGFQDIIGDFLGQMTRNDLVVWYYHGKSGGEDENWKM